FVG
ncbi:hypothetical protein D043_1169B, partial [Vibrio parahaemolyticus EKP-021]